MRREKSEKPGSALRYRRSPQSSAKPRRRTDKIQQGPMYKGFGGRGEHRGILPFSKSRVPPIPSVASKPSAFLTDLGDVDD